MRSVVSRLARLERLNQLSTAPQRWRIQYGYLQTLPDDYGGPRHVVPVRQIPARAGCVFRGILVRVGGTTWPRAGLDGQPPQRRDSRPRLLQGRGSEGLNPDR